MKRVIEQNTYFFLFNFEFFINFIINNEKKTNENKFNHQYYQRIRQIKKKKIL